MLKLKSFSTKDHDRSIVPPQGFPTSDDGVALYFHFALGFPHPNTCTHVRLLGPCFKTGRIAPFRQSPERQQVTTALNRQTCSQAQQAVQANSSTRTQQTRERVVGTSVPTATTNHKDIIATEVTYLLCSHFPQSELTLTSHHNTGHRQASSPMKYATDYEH